MDPNRVWYGRHPLGVALAPLSWLYCGIVALRRAAYRRGMLERIRLPVPVVVVGNLTVGGTGKTPAVLALARLVRSRGWTPAIITRGYGGHHQDGPARVPPEADPQAYGDEPLLLARRSGCPVVAGRDRVAAGRLALGDGQVDLLIADDGLQHHRLQPDLEILLIDGSRGFGNGRCLPAGPLREPRERLDSVDFILVTTGGQDEHPRESWPSSKRMWLAPGRAINLLHPERTRPLASFRDRPLFAVAAIGNPARFFAMLQAHGLCVQGRAYPDHHPFSQTEVSGWPSGPVLMTEKDAVKCAPFATADHWFLPVDAVLESAFIETFLQRLETCQHG
ncbi:tetraacyldisaccharide 4'-kinase [Thiocapsa imhoffii]|uniref:Tetraacyldisaccharide 4'-kinase n=1 Tax=Thiocapsa imhoffii TaxID=382777 RepID=A0A9X0WL82_9GAMM|nr:tetraacyldisaccharide 4'-kinase [Thiocapsa imhoffii]MBK1646540.1 tetraacyldisaccharide 4'-kinase [Thiocapsa imhoffii]